MTKKSKRIILITLINLIVVAGILTLLAQTYDPVRVVYKRLKAKSPYIFEELDPAYQEVDPKSFLSLHRPQDSKTKLQRLEELYRLQVPQMVRDQGWQTEINNLDSNARWLQIRSEIEDWDGVASYNRLVLRLDERVESVLYHLAPETPTGRSVVYHHGFGDPFYDRPALFERLLEAGVDVVIVNHFGYGENELTFISEDCARQENLKLCDLNHHYDIDEIARAFYYQMGPVFYAADYLKQLHPSAEVDLIGFSSGAISVTVAAAMREDVRAVFAVAGVYPDYLRDIRESGVGLARYNAMRSYVSMMDLFVLSAVRTGHISVQVFNRFDRCCYRNVKSRLYLPAVIAALEQVDGKGRFSVRIDESHADHKISSQTIDAFLAVVTGGAG